MLCNLQQLDNIALYGKHMCSYDFQKWASGVLMIHIHNTTQSKTQQTHTVVSIGLRVQTDLVS